MVTAKKEMGKREISRGVEINLVRSVKATETAKYSKRRGKAVEQGLLKEINIPCPNGSEKTSRKLITVKSCVCLTAS